MLYYVIFPGGLVTTVEYIGNMAEGDRVVIHDAKAKDWATKHYTVEKVWHEFVKKEGGGLRHYTTTAVLEECDETP